MDFLNPKQTPRLPQLYDSVDERRIFMQVSQSVHAVWQERIFSILAGRYLESGLNNAARILNQQNSLDFLEAVFHSHPARLDLFKNKRPCQSTEVSSLDPLIFKEIKEHLLIKTHLDYQPWFKNDSVYRAIATSMKGSYKAFNEIPQLSVSNIPAITTKLIQSSDGCYINKSFCRGYIKSSGVKFFALRLRLEYEGVFPLNGKSNRMSIALVFTQNRNNIWSQEENEMLPKGQIHLTSQDHLKGIVELLQPKKDWYKPSASLLSLFKTKQRSRPWIMDPQPCINVCL